MKNYVFLVLGFISTFGNPSMAQSVFYDRDALRICSRQIHDYEKRKCMEQIKEKRYDNSVIDICAKQTFDFEKINCLAIIENKRFLAPAETYICRTQFFDYDKRRCLQNASTTSIYSVSIPVPSAPLYVIEGQVTNAINAIQAKNYGRAESILQNLKNQIQSLQQMGLQ